MYRNIINKNEYIQYRYLVVRFKRESGKSRCSPRYCERRRVPLPLFSACKMICHALTKGEGGRRMTREPGDLPIMCTNAFGGKGEVWSNRQKI